MTRRFRNLKFSLNSAQKLLPKRTSKSNKSNGGRSLIIAGSPGLWGAGILSARAAARVGSGYVLLMTDLKKLSPLKCPDFLTANLQAKNLSKLKFNAVGVGPGLGTKQITKQILQQLLSLKVKNVVADADALTVCAEEKIFPLPGSWIITPHEGELARLLDVPAKLVKQDRKKYLLQAQQQMDCIVLLKGAKTLIADGQKVFQIQTGNKSLAKAGTGDVLTGMITGFLAQGLEPINAALLGASLHGKIADDWMNEHQDYLGLMASDLIELLPKTIYRLRQQTVSLRTKKRTKP